MSGSLSRVLRLRALEEDLARMALEAEVAELRAIERSSAEAQGEARSSRERWFAVLAVGLDGGAEEDQQTEESAGRQRRGEEMVWDLALWRRGIAEAQRPAQEAAAGRARAEYLERRRERMQVESLVEAAAAIERSQAERRAQRELDDWYQARAEGRRGRHRGDDRERERGESSNRAKF